MLGPPSLKVHLGQDRWEKTSSSSFRLNQQVKCFPKCCYKQLLTTFWGNTFGFWKTFLICWTTRSQISIVRHWSHRHWSHQTLITPDIDHTVCKIGHWSHQTLITPDIDHTGHWSHQTLITLCVKKDIDHTRHWSHRVWNRTLITPDIDHIRHWSHYV